MPNVLTNLAADIYTAADTVGRELVGFIPSVLQGTESTAAAKGDTVRSHFTRPAVASDSNPSMTIPEGTDQEVDNKTLQLTKSRSVQIPWTGEDIRSLNNGSGHSRVYMDQLVQAMRTLTNEVEADLALEAKNNASRAFGTAGTAPFGSDFNSLAQLGKILKDNGAPAADRQSSVIIDTTAGANLRSLAQLQKANENGSDALLRQGTLLDLQGFMLKESGSVASHTKGTGTGYLVNGGASAGDTVIPVDTGSGTVVAGDVVTIDGDNNKYVVQSATGSAITIAAPGLRQDAADNAAVTVGDNYTGNIALHRNAVELAMRPVAEPEGGDAATDRMEVVDEHSGLAFTISEYKGYKKVMYDVSAVWGVKAWLPNYIASLQG